MDGGAWWAGVHGVTKSRTRLSDFTFTFHFHALEKEMATHSSVLAWSIPGTGEPGGLPSMGSHGVGHDWSDLAAAAAADEVTSPGFTHQSVVEPGVGPGPSGSWAPVPVLYAMLASKRDSNCLRWESRGRWTADGLAAIDSVWWPQCWLPKWWGGSGWLDSSTHILRLRQVYHEHS